MESPANENEKALELAGKRNEALAERVTRWKRCRLGCAIGLAVAGIGAFFFSAGVSSWSVPCFLGAFIAYLLYLDSRDQVREIRARRWHAITPRMDRLTARNPQNTESASSP